MPDCSVDAVATDPPYALVSIVQRFGSEDASPSEPKEGAAGAYARASAGFMGQQWDTGETAFAAEFWREVLRVLKPGGHVVAFSGTRTYHRMAVAIEDAGFEVRDQLAWCYGTGFPKSHNVSKGIDDAFYRAWLARNPNTKQRIARLLQWAKGRDKRQASKGLAKRIDAAFRRRTGFRKVIGLETLANDMRNSALLKTGKGGARAAYVREVVAPATPEAEEWDGWGTALKPAWEPICLARKPLSESSVAANVLKWRVGAINIRACKIVSQPNGATTEGRHPANIITDGSAEVLAAFPEAPGQQRPVTGDEPRRNGTVYGAYDGVRAHAVRLDEGSAARFFYSAKAGADDRNGSEHPTVKPVDLMRWLVRLVCPKGGVVLDPFAGTGPTGEAAFWEGCNAVLIELEAEYQRDIANRMSLVLAGPEERKRARTTPDPAEDLPLFGAGDMGRKKSRDVTTPNVRARSHACGVDNLQTS